MCRIPSSWGPNVIAPDSDYPLGRSKDTPNGTPMKELTMGDFQQFFFKMLFNAGITANGLPDNEYNGNQYFQAAKKEFQGVEVFFTDGSAPVQVSPHESATIYQRPGAIPGQTVALANVADTYEGCKVKIANDSSETIDVSADTNIDYLASPPYTVPANSYVEFTLIAGFWAVTQK